MADAEDSRDEDSWLYGDSVTLPSSDIKKEADSSVNENIAPPGEPLPPGETTANANNEESHEGTEPGEVRDDEPPAEPSSQDNGVPETTREEGGGGGGEEEDDDDDDDSEDGIHVTIGDIKTAPQYTNINIKRGAQLSSGIEKLTKQGGKFSIEEFESIGLINGVPAHEFSIDALEEKPWRKPGADITDYFNYGFNEETWRAYCERQKQMRVQESGVGLGGLGVTRGAPLTVVENSKYSNSSSTILVGGTAPGSLRKSTTNSTRRPGVIDVIGSTNSRRSDVSPPKESPIQVMGSDNRREYNRKNFDMSVPPPGFDAPPPSLISYPVHHQSHGGYNQEYYNAEMDPYYGSYESQQDLQWGGGQLMNQVWSSRHRDKKSRSSSHSLDSKRTKYSSSNPVSKDVEVPGVMPIKQEPVEKSSKERERDREQRHKERHRHRSRSRSGERAERSERRRKHKSRSRSPGHRSHKKKKSKKSDRNKESSD